MARCSFALGGMATEAAGGGRKPGGGGFANFAAAATLEPDGFGYNEFNGV